MEFTLALEFTFSSQQRAVNFFVPYVGKAVLFSVITAAAL